MAVCGEDPIPLAGLPFSWVHHVAQVRVCRKGGIYILHHCFLLFNVTTLNKDLKQGR